MECVINGQKADITQYQEDELVQALLISLFSWRKSNSDDGVAIPNRQGWWGDTFSETTGDKIGSRLWLLQREKLTNEVVQRAQYYAKEALQWLIDDALAIDVQVDATKVDSTLNLTIQIIKASDQKSIEARFQDLWSS